MDQVTKDAFAALTKTVERGLLWLRKVPRLFAASSPISAPTSLTCVRSFAGLRTGVKSDIALLREQVTGIEQELKSIRRELDELTDKVENILGYRKETDYALERIAAIEEHLGIRRNWRIAISAACYQFLDMEVCTER